MLKGSPWEWNEACPEEGYQTISPAGAPHAKVPEAGEYHGTGVREWAWCGDMDCVVRLEQGCR